MSCQASKPSMRRRHALQLFKTDMCQFFLEGRCENGDLCSYAHKETEVRNKPDLTKTSMCRKLLRDGACNDERCRFAHSEAELRSTSGFFKMKMCVFAQSGKCKNGNRCRFAHTTDELLPPKPPKVEEEASIQDKKIDAQALSSLGQRHKTAPSQQESHGTGGSTATGNGESTSGNGGSTSGHASGQSSNENSGSGEAQQAHQQAQRQSRRATNLPQKWTTEQMERTENSNENSDGSSWASGNSSVTVVPRSEHTTTGSPQPTSDSSSSGAANTESAANASTGATESLSKGRRGQRTLSGGDLEQATTLLISNMPIYLTQGALLSMFEDLTTTMRGKFDFFYCPWDHKAGHNFGYAIINFTDVAHANEFQQQWTNKDLFRSGRGSKTMKVSKATLQGFDANVDYFRKAEIGGRCRDLRFRPLYRDGEGKLQHLELALPGGVQPRKPGAAEVNHHLRKVTRAADIPKEPDTGQGGESKKAAVLGTSRPEERSRSQVEERRGRPRKRRPDMAEASAAAEAPPPSTPLPEQQEVMPGVQPHDIWQKMSLQQQQQECLQKLMAREEETRRNRRNQRRAQEFGQRRAESPMSSDVTEMSRVSQTQMPQHALHQVQQHMQQVQQLQLRAMQMQQIQSAQLQTRNLGSMQPDNVSQVAPSVGQYLVATIPSDARESGQLAMHLASQVYPMDSMRSLPSAAAPQSYVNGFGYEQRGLSGAQNHMQMVPYMMLPVQDFQLQMTGEQFAPTSVPGNQRFPLDEVYTD